MENFSKTFVSLCAEARKESFQDKEQHFVCSAVVDGERHGILLSIRELPFWLETNMQNKAVINYCTPPSLF